MTIEATIKILTAGLVEYDGAPHANFDDALRLGIEALKRVQTNRQPIRAHWREPLPGETEE